MRMPKELREDIQRWQRHLTETCNDSIIAKARVRFIILELEALVREREALRVPQP
jgi:hypothetical protein